MNTSPSNILAIISLILGVIAIAKPEWRLLPICVILLSVAIIIK